MQLWCEDWSEGEFGEEDYDIGGCLNCSDSEEGCLCSNCKCKQCYWYIPPEEWNFEKGKCGLILQRKKQKLNAFLKSYSKNKPKRKQKYVWEFENDK